MNDYDTKTYWSPYILYILYNYTKHFGLLRCYLDFGLKYYWRLNRITSKSVCKSRITKIRV